MHWIAKYPFAEAPELDAGALVALVSPTTKVDKAAFALRRLGVEIRDAISYQSAEPLVVLVGHCHTAATYVDQVVRGGTGVYAIDASRVGISQEDFAATQRSGDYGGSTPGMFGVGIQMRQPVNPEGRFPTNLILTAANAEIMDDQSGGAGSVVKFKQDSKNINRDVEKCGIFWSGEKEAPASYGDSGGASRFYHHLETIEDVIAHLETLFVGPTLTTG